MELEPIQYIIAIVGGVFAGILNTLAGNGSAITLTILLEVLNFTDANMANGTNRVGILAQGLMSSYKYQRKGLLNLNRGKLYIITMIIGAIIGVAVAVSVSNEQFKSVFKVLLLLMLVILVVNPKRWFRETDLTHSVSPWITIPLFLALGFYGGFIQMGMGIFFLATMVLVARFSIKDANIIKVFVIAAYTIIVILVFQWQGLIDWKVGLVLAFGQATGAWLATNFAINSPRADSWAYRLLITVIIFAIIRSFGIWDWAIQLLGY